MKAPHRCRPGWAWLSSRAVTLALTSLQQRHAGRVVGRFDGWLGRR